MKKLLLVISFLLLAGCTFFQKQQEPVPVVKEEEVKTEKKIGVVSASEDQSLLQSPAPFVLVSENGERVFINSAEINLKKYNRRKVEVEGKWDTPAAGTSTPIQGSRVFIVNMLTTLDRENQSKEAYQNPELGLKFSYPGLWSLKEEKSILGLQRVIITPYEVDDDEISSIDRIVIERSENNRRLSPREWLGLDEKYQSADPHNTESVYQQSVIGVGELDAVKKTIGSGDTVEFYVKRDSFIYRFIHTTVNDSDKDIYRNAFHEIVASFEFISFGKTKEAATTPQCSATKPCSGDFVCEQGKCIGVADCFRDTDCGQGQRCYKGSCEALPKSTTTDSSPKIEQKSVEPPKTAEEKVSLEPSSRQLFMNYIKSNIATLAKEPSTSGAWTVISFEFTFPEGEPQNFNAVYVLYSDNTEKRKILLTVLDRTKPESMTLSAYFKPGETTDWQLSEGSDTAKKNEKALINVADSASSQEIVIKSGMALLDAKSYKIKIQYPAKWYWAYVQGGYSFSDKPISDISQSFFPRLLKNPEALPTEMANIGTIGSFKTTQGEMAELLSICAEGSNAKYCLSGAPEYAETMKQMLETLQE